MLARVCTAGCVALVALAATRGASAQTTSRRSTVDGAAILRLLGPRARDAFAPPGSPGMGALVTLPSGTRAADVGLREVAPGIARLWGSPESIVAFSDARPAWHVEVAPPLHLLLDTASKYVGAVAARMHGFDGTGALVGIADTGIDPFHPDFLDATKHTRIAWLLDLSAAPIGKHPDLEAQFGSTDAQGNVVSGAVWSAKDIDLVLASGTTSQAPKDEVGHGTLVASCAAGNGMNGKSVYGGVAQGAKLVIARITGAGSESIGNDELLRGVQFLFDRADNDLHRPIVVNLSIGTDFGPHDGTMAWEKTLASYVGNDQPGHAIVAAAGNSGSISETPVHQSVHVSGTRLRVPVVTGGATSGGAQIWVAMHAGANVSVGLDAPDGTWISPVAPNDSGGKDTSDVTAGVYNGACACEGSPGCKCAGDPVPHDSHGAVVIWQGKWARGTYYVTLEGSGTVDLYAQGTGDASIPGLRDVGFAHAVREGTINLPATHPSILGVGCTINKRRWISADAVQLGLVVPVLDAAGGLPDPGGATRDPIDGEPCWFSSAGPTLAGLPKPEIMAPGAAIIGAMSQQAEPPTPSSIFTNPSCPGVNGHSATRCEQIDALHGVSFGTSFSAPMVSGAIAILLGHDAALTQETIVAALQGGAHRLRGPAPFDDQAGAGEVDVLGALTALDRAKNPVTALPVRSESWMTLGADVVLADGSTPLEAVVELRAASAANEPAPPADGSFDGRLVPYALRDGEPYADAALSLDRRGPGVWMLKAQVPAGLGGSTLTLGAKFDGEDVVDPKSVPVATDEWTAEYPSRVRGGCAMGGGSGGGATGVDALAAVAWIVVVRRARRRSAHRCMHRPAARGSS